MDHAGVRPCDHNCDPDRHPAIHVQNGFIHFCYHELTKIIDYDQGLLSKHAINRKKWRKMVPLIAEVLTMLILILLLPKIQYLIHWFMLVVVRIRVSKYDVNYGVSLDFP